MEPARIVVGPEIEDDEPEYQPGKPVEIVAPPVEAKTAKAARKKWWKLANRMGYHKHNPPKTAPAGDSKSKKRAAKKKAEQSRKRNRR